MSPMLAALALATPALAGVNMPMSEAIEEGYVTVLQVTAGAPACDTFSVDERGNLSQSFSAQVVVDEVLCLPEDAELVEAEEVVVLAWSNFVGGPEYEDEAVSCEQPPFALTEGEERPVAVYATGDGFEVDAWYHVDGQHTVAGEGSMPPCGEAEQAQVIAELEAEPEPEPGDSGDPASDDDAADASAGCAVGGLPAAGPLAGLLLLVGLGRRRR